MERSFSSGSEKEKFDDSKNKMDKKCSKEQRKLEKILRKQKKTEKKEIKKLKKEKKKLKKLLKKKSTTEDKLKNKSIIGPDPTTNTLDLNEVNGEVNNVSKVKGPMTKEEWEAQQSVVERVHDPESGRFRLVKGSGEILEECVSRERHKEINKTATKGDGLFYQSTIMSKLKK